MRRCLPKPTYITNKLSRRPRGPHNYGDPEPGPRYTRSGSNPNPNVQFLAHNLRGKKKNRFSIGPWNGGLFELRLPGAAVGAIRSGPTAGAAFEIYDFLTIGNRLWSGFIIWPGKLLNFNSKIMPHSAVLMNCAARPISMTFLWPRRRMSNDFWALIRP